MAAHERVLAGLSTKTEPVASVDDEGNEDGRWHVNMPCWSRQDDFYEYELNLSQAEELQAERLILNDELELEPYAYKESLSGRDSIEIRFRVRTSPEETDRLFDFMDAMNEKDGYFPVVRVGVSDEPRMMRFGGSLWSSHEDGDKHDLFLLDQAFDEGQPALRPIFADFSARRTIAGQVERVDRLLQLLVDRGLLSEENVAQLKRNAGEAAKRRYRRFELVDDVDVY